MKSTISDPYVFLQAGEFHFASAPGRIGTLLGSCVSITLWHPWLRFGGMSHILLPGRRRTDEAPLDGRYADETLELFAQELKERNIPPGACQAKLFGGSNMLAGSAAGATNIGQRNVDATRRAMARHGLKVVGEHAGGTTPRRLFLDLSSGRVWLAAHGKQQSHGRVSA